MANQRGETTSIGHFYNRCVDAVNNLFDTMSFWTHSKDVEFVDGKTAETKVGAINGITSDMSGEADDIAASIKCVNQLNNSLTANNNQFHFDYQDGKYGYNTDPNRGADTFFPFKSSANCTITLTMPWTSSMNKSGTITITIQIVNGVVTSVTNPGLVVIDGNGDGNWIRMKDNSASLIEN